MEVFEIKAAKENDATEVYNFKKVHFDTSEPVRLSHVGKVHGHRDIKHLLGNVKSENVLMAIEISSNNLVGISICESVDTKVGEFERAGNENEDSGFRDLIKFFNYVEEKSNICEKFQIQEFYHIFTISVHPDYRGQGIATKLFEASFDLAKSKNFKLITVECSSVYTAKIAQKMKMECISTVTYEEVNNHLGKKLFVPRSPHNDVKTFAKKLL